MKISIVVAMTRERVIGINNRLPWHLSEDLRRFKQLTTGHTVIMGRKTFESIGKPLPNRKNIVLTSNPDLPLPEGVFRAADLHEALASCGEDDEIFIIGGCRVFEAALPLAEKLHITWIEKDYKGDVYFPEFDLKKDFRIVEEEKGMGEKADRIPYTFVTALREANS